MNELIIDHVVFGAVIFALGCVLIIMGNFALGLGCVIVIIMIGFRDVG